MESKHINTEEYLKIPMGTQISLKLSDKLFDKAKQYSNENGYENLQELIRQLLREKLFSTSIASEKALAKYWKNSKEDKAWQHLQKKK